MANRMVWLPSLSRDRKWPRVTKCTHSRVVGLRKEGNRVITTIFYHFINNINGVYTMIHVRRKHIFVTARAEGHLANNEWSTQCPCYQSFVQQSLLGRCSSSSHHHHHHRGWSVLQSAEVPCLAADHQHRAVQSARRTVCVADDVRWAGPWRSPAAVLQVLLTAVHVVQAASRTTTHGRWRLVVDVVRGSGNCLRDSQTPVSACTDMRRLHVHQPFT